MKMNEAITYEDLVSSPILYRNILGGARYIEMLMDLTPDDAESIEPRYERLKNDPYPNHETPFVGRRPRDDK